MSRKVTPQWTDAQAGEVRNAVMLQIDTVDEPQRVRVLERALAELDRARSSTATQPHKAVGEGQ